MKLLFLIPGTPVFSLILPPITVINSALLTRRIFESLKAITYTFPILEHRLSNGLLVLIIEDHSLPIICYSTTFKVGSRNEYQKPGQSHGITGMSHLFEHMMFNGSKKFGEGVFDHLLESSGGNSNAWTSKDMTFYYDVFPSECLDLVIDMESDRMANLSLTKKMFTSEREIVKEERRMSTENSITGTMWEALYKHAFTTHSYHWPVVGWMDDLNAMTLADCKSFYRKYYSPSNAILIVAGDVEFSPLINKLETAYGAMLPVIVDDCRPAIEPGYSGEKKIEIRRQAELERWLMGYLGCAGSHPDTSALDIIQQIMADGDSSRLVKKLVHDAKIAIDVSGTFHWGIDPDLFLFDFRVRPDVSGDRALQQFDDQIDQLTEKLVSPREFQKAKNQLTSQLIYELSTQLGKCTEISNYHMVFNDHKMVFRMIDRYMSVTRQDVLRAAQTYLRRDNRIIIRLIPDQNGTPHDS